MFIYVVDEDIEFFRLILSFQFIRNTKKLFVLLKKQKKDCVLSIRTKFKKLQNDVF